VGCAFCARRAAADPSNSRTPQGAILDRAALGIRHSPQPMTASRPAAGRRPRVWRRARPPARVDDVAERHTGPTAAATGRLSASRRLSLTRSRHRCCQRKADPPREGLQRDGLCEDWRSMAQGHDPCGPCHRGGRRPAGGHLPPASAASARGEPGAGRPTAGRPPTPDTGAGVPAVARRSPYDPSPLGTRPSAGSWRRVRPTARVDDAAVRHSDPLNGNPRFSIIGDVGPAV